MSKRRRKRQKRSFSQTIVLIVSGMIAASMVISLIIVALPGPQVAAPTPLPTWTPLPPPTAAPSPTTEPSPTPDAPSLPTLEPTEPPIGPEPATATPTITPTVTTTPSGASLTLTFAVAGDSRDNPNVYRQVLAAVMDSGSEEFLALMVEQHVDYVFAGQIHAYAREERDGVTYIITGGAGAPLYGSDHALAFHHYLRVAIQDGDVTVDVVEV